MNELSCVTLSDFPLYPPPNGESPGRRLSSHFTLTVGLATPFQSKDPSMGREVGVALVFQFRPKFQVVDEVEPWWRWRFCQRRLVSEPTCAMDMTVCYGPSDTVAHPELAPPPSPLQFVCHHPDVRCLSDRALRFYLRTSLSIAFQSPVVPGHLHQPRLKCCCYFSPLPLKVKRRFSFWWPSKLLLKCSRSSNSHLFVCSVVSNEWHSKKAEESTHFFAGVSQMCNCPFIVYPSRLYLCGPTYSFY